ncbi:MAG: hypothetical protein IH984_02150 [Planctomycetes bacterium]|nr:hypothetical protein [Planctomycetota bacterium]
MSNYEPHECDFCTGTVNPLRADSEPIKVCGRMVLIDGPTIGKCNRCGHRYFPADIIKKAEKAALNPDQAQRTEIVPVVAA